MLWRTNYWIATELLPADRPLLAASARALRAGALLLLLAARTLPPHGWRLRIATLATLNVGLFFVLLLIAAERLPGGAAAGQRVGQTPPARARADVAAQLVGPTPATARGELAATHVVSRD